MNNKKEKSKDSQEILATARARFKLSEEAESKLRSVMLEDLKFRAGDQWPENIKRERESDDRPCLTINKMPQFVRQITNDQRQNRPVTKVFPVDAKANAETAKIFQGIIRHIEYDSHSDVAYDTAFESAVTSGRGFYRIIAQYIPGSFEQELKIKRIRNPFKVYMDPDSQEPDGSDMNWCLIVKDMPVEDYKQAYGESELASMKDWASIGDAVSSWANASTCRVAEYFYRDYEKVEICQLFTGEIVETSELEEMFPEGIPDIMEGEKFVTKKRMSEKPVIRHLHINAIEILDETVWPGGWIPIVPVIGDELDIDGDRVLEGIIRHAKDSQRMNNFWASNETEMISLAPKAPFIAAEGQIPKEYQAQWKSANKKNHAFLVYKPVALSGQLMPAPQRQAYEPPVQAITNARMQASEDIKATTGIYDSSLGARSNETSGIAIRSRANQAQTSNFHFIDNLTRSIRHGSRILVDAIPVVYDTPRVVRIIKEDGEQEMVQINQIFKKPNGEEAHYDLTIGKYDLIVDTGPSFATKREESAAMMMDFLKTIPQLAPNVADLVAASMDWNGSTELTERLRKLLPPNLIEDDKQLPIPPQVKAQLDQMGQLVEQLTKTANESTEIIKNKKMELESKERIEFAKMEVDMRKELLKQAAPMSHLSMEQEIARINQRLALLDMDQPINDDFQDSESVPDQDAIPNDQQQPPTDGLSSGQPMGEMP